MIYNFKKNIFVPKKFKKKVLHGALFMWTLWVFFSRFSNCKMTSIYFDVSFDIGLGGFVGG
jgi:hypothetical protein